MDIRVETYSAYRYDEIQKEYGSVLNKFNLTEAEYGRAYITINSLEDLLNIDKELRIFKESLPDWNVYFGLIVSHDSKGPLLEIKDNYD